jgi:hypothetical protein
MTTKTHIKYNTILPIVMAVQQFMIDELGDEIGTESQVVIEPAISQL